MIRLIFAVLAILMTMDTVICQEANSTLVAEVETTVIPVTTAHAATGSTEESDDEKPITETIRTYIEDSVKSVKHAISKIGKFVGEFFDDSSANSTTTATVNVTVIPTTVLPTTVTLNVTDDNDN